MPIYLSRTMFCIIILGKGVKKWLWKCLHSSSLQRFQLEGFVFLLKWLGSLSGSQGLLNHNSQFFIAFCHWLKHHSNWKNCCAFIESEKPMGTDLPSAFPLQGLCFWCWTFVYKFLTCHPLKQKVRVEREGCHKMHTQF